MILNRAIDNEDLQILLNNNFLLSSLPSFFPAVGVITIPRGFLPDIRGGTVITPTTSKERLVMKIKHIMMIFRKVRLNLLNSIKRNTMNTKRKMSTSNSLKLLAAFIIGLIPMSCVNGTQPANKVKQEIVVYSKCSSVEASSDILYSVNEIKDQLKKKSVREDSSKKLCGYLLVSGVKTKTITGALTDLELLQEIDKFFK